MKNIFKILVPFLLVLLIVFPVNVFSASPPLSEYQLMVKAWDKQFIKWNNNVWVAAWDTKTNKWQTSLIAPLPKLAPYSQSIKPQKPRDDTETYYAWDSLGGIWNTNWRESMSTKYEYYDIGYDGSYPAYGAVWLAQTFIPQIAHTITSVKLKLYRIGSLGTTTVGIRATSGGHPTGADLCSGTYDGDLITDSGAGDWYEITLGTGVSLTQDTKYAIVLDARNSVGGGALQWRRDASDPTYANGNMERSTDSGVNWTSYTGTDFYFEEWGYVAGAQNFTVPVCALGVRCARPLLTNDINFDVPLCEATCATLQVYIPMNFTVPICALTCTPLQVSHTHALNHPIIKPEYFDAPKLVNRVYAVGIDADGNMVYGEAKDTTINGEELQIYPDSMISTQADAGTIAANILAKDRLNAERGQILIPPAIHQELWDVIKINDTVCNQSNTTYRVSGWTLTYQSFIPNQQEAKYEQLMKLTAV